jgi:hypothetical protein
LRNDVGSLTPRLEKVISCATVYVKREAKVICKIDLLLSRMIDEECIRHPFFLQPKGAIPSKYMWLEAQQQLGGLILC